MSEPIRNTLNILEDPQAWLAREKQALDAAIQECPVRKATKPGNITMREYLIQVRQELETKPQEVITKRAQLAMEGELRDRQIRELSDAR